MDPTKVRMRYLIAILIAAILVAGMLRHFLHVSGGFSRKEILEGSIAVIVTISAITVLIRWRRRR